ncbi:DUF2799 domain-containing protein [Vibrio sagamiensis]|uniref:DUF2799 domain-containing protein n=1 Tax=Vibrio sagamiensis TaxID=512650 RepID=UPI00039E40CC|nr:DUF2799 domain-containing protein [Vibrio sagamiensis]
MQKYFFVPLVTILLGSLSGCASISQEECLLGDWYQLGLADGQGGKKNYAADYKKDCSEYKVKMDVKAYNQGRDEGLKAFCTYENGVSFGQLNKTYNYVCPADLSDAFLFGYQPYYNLANAESKRETIEEKIEHYRDLLLDEELSKSDRKEYRNDLKSAKRDLKELDIKIRKYEKELELHKIQVEKAKITKQLSSRYLSNSQRIKLRERLDSLTQQESVYKSLSYVENTLKSIKDIADMFEYESVSY